MFRNLISRSSGLGVVSTAAVVALLCLGLGCPGIPQLHNSDGLAHVYGDGSAGDLLVTEDTLLSGVAPTGNLQFRDIVIDAGATLTVPSGTTLRCTGTFNNHGTLIVSTGAMAPTTSSTGSIANPGISLAGAESMGVNRGGRGLTTEQATVFLDVPVNAGGAGATNSLTILGHNELGGNGGGGLGLLVRGALVNAGTIQADGGNAAENCGSGGGAGGVVILASPTAIENTGTIFARGGVGGITAFDFDVYGAGGGGGGGIVHLLSPSVSTGTVDVSGGAGGASDANLSGARASSGGGGGACGGNGGAGSAVLTYEPYVSVPSEAGDSGQVITTLADPTDLLW